MIDNENTESTIKTNLISKNLFGIPIYKSRFKHHSVLKPKWLEYLANKENFRKNTRNNRLLFTTPNIHKEEIFEPLKDFVLDSLQQVMKDNGFIPNINLTGMWATVHPDGGYHHRHHHHNAYWAGVYYLDGSDTSAGTTFYSPYYYNGIITPAREKNTSTKMRSDYTSQFEEGTLVIFPAWLQHATASNNLRSTGKYRKIVSFNAMPVGATNNDPFDRYYFPEVDGDKLVKHNVDLFDYNPQEDDIVDRLDYFNHVDSDISVQSKSTVEINNLRGEVDSMKSDLADIKNLLLKALESK